MCATRWSVVLPALILSSLCPSRAAEKFSPGTRYHVKTTTAITVSLPLDGAKGQHLYQTASGAWRELPDAKQTGNTFTFRLSPEQLRGGSTTLVIGKPDWLDLSDQAPPKVTSVTVDGKPSTGTDDIDLGWIDRAPRSVEVQVADERNPIDPSSITVTVNGAIVRPDGRRLRAEVDPAAPKKVRISCTVPDLMADSPHGTTRLTFQCDDFAADAAVCTANLSFTVTRPPEIKLDRPAATSPNGTKVFVDSIHSGYENVECLVDGEIQAPGTTTYGKTWASAETDADHWVCFVLPEPRPISGVAITWANYRNTFWTSRRYDIMTWHGEAWRRALRVQKNPEAQTSKHAFKAQKTDRLLIWVPGSGNHPQRPNLTWITEVAIQP